MAVPRLKFKIYSTYYLYLNIYVTIVKVNKTKKQEVDFNNENDENEYKN